MGSDENTIPYLNEHVRVVGKSNPGISSVKKRFYALVTAIFIGLETGLAAFVIKWTHPYSVALFFVLSFIFIGTSYGISRQIIALVSRYRPLNSLNEIPAGKRVALLYATMNDVVPECLSSISQSYACDVFVLDDSTSAAATATVDAISSEKGYRVIRRKVRKGYKAGAINNWFAEHSESYDYIVLLDSDSYLPPDWVAEALKYAEHRANSDVAVFQGLVNIWNLDTEFVQTLAPMSRIGQFVWEEQLANELDAVFCYGHNVMVRMSSLREVGGFVEGYVSEDFATAVKLAEKGWHCRFLPLHTYEAMPENVRGFIKRQNKWTRGSMEFFGLSLKSALSADRKYLLLQTPLGHFTNMLLPIGMILTVYGFTSTGAGTSAFLSAFISNPLFTFWSVPVLRYLLVVGIFSAIPNTLVRLKCRIRYPVYLRARWLSAAVAAISFPYEFKSMLTYIRSGIRTVPVTPKSEEPLTISEILHISRYSMGFELVLVAGIAMFNPLAAVFNCTWLIPMLVSPLIIRQYGGYPRGNPAVSGASDFSSSALFPDPVSVHSALSSSSARVSGSGRTAKRSA